MAAEDASQWTPHLLALPSLTPTLAAEVLPRGLTIHRLYVQADGQTHDILIGPEDPKDHLGKKYTNTVIGRYTNRLPVGTHEIERKGVKGVVTPIGNESPTVSLHGGPTGYDSLPWTPLPPSSATLFTPAEIATIEGDLPASQVWTYTSADGEMGFGGTLRVEVLTALLSPHPTPPSSQRTQDLGAFVIVYRAKLEEEGKASPVNLTQHWGFNLSTLSNSASPAGSIKEHEITMKATSTVTVDPTTFLPTGTLNPVDGTPHDRRTKHKLGERWPEGGVDDCYVFPPPPTRSPYPTRIPAADLKGETNLVKQILEEKLEGERRLVELDGPSGISVAFGSNQSAVQFYTNNFATGEGARKRIHGGSGAVGSGQGYGPGSAAFLEFHQPLAAFLHPALRVGGQGEDTVVVSGEVYNNWVKVEVGVRG